ncbi:uncharacterized protein LOC123686529 [Harmonia axyridis]|uniref:uncharacterized protein LOC123686529 n=1 Tax=Harmonia axyridis TaxID=115357 RepID=UPI001E2799E6|nr:uncharacterized protein LOC123686529 [Harmonia axyridis]
MDARLLKTLMEKKQNETSNNRLESLRLPRDLSLGGTKPKKIIQPNLNVTRSKQKAKESTKKPESTKKEKPKPQPRKRFSDNKRFVQSQGVFSQGFAHDKKVSGFGSRTKCESQPSSSMAIPTFRKNESEIDSDKEDDMFSNLTSMKLEEDDVKCIQADEWNHNTEYHTFDNLKMEEDNHPYFCKMEEAEMNAKLALIKMPQSLAGRVLSDNTNDSKQMHYNLRMMTEGKIGSLQITRSGKMYMKIGNMRYLMEAIDCTGGSEMITSYMASTSEGNKAKFAVLGDIEGRFQLVPQWTRL